ncbi:MAG: DNA polymerase I, partial [Candidatus Uhrbacteria bacterium]
AGIGDKTATELIQKFGSLKQMYQDFKAGKTRDLKPKIVEKLLENEQVAFDSKELVTIVLDVPVKFKLSDVKLGQQDEEKIVKLYKDYEFKSLLRKRGQVENQPKKVTKTTKTQKTSNDLETLRGAKELAFFAGENQQADLFGSGLATLALSDGQKTVVVSNPSVEQIRVALDILSQTKLIICHDVKRLLHLLPFTQSDLPFYDLMIASYLLNAGSRSHALEDVAQESVGAELQLPEDVGRFFEIYKKQTSELKDGDMIKLFDEIEMPLVPILYQMEKEGIEIDTDFLAKFSKELSKRLEKLTKDIQKEAGQEFNVNSPLQLTEILFEKLELPTKGIKRTKSGYSTAASELEKLRDAHKIIPMVEEYRELAKLASTYVDALPKLVAKDGRVHSSFNQVVTTTGRLSSSDPNLQNIPIRTELGREIRKAFVAGKNKVLLSSDYSQIDLRVVTIITKDKAFMKAFNDGADIHTRTASEVWNIPEDKVTKSQRRSAKAINFGIIYGMGPRALAASTDLTFSEAQIFIEDYLNAHPALQKYLEETKESAHELGYVETMFGRRRYLPELDSGVHMLVAAAERMAINMPVQGAASDIMKIAMIKVFKWLQDKDDIKMLLQVHDELVFEVAKDKVESYGKKIKSIMEEAVDLGVPLVVDVEAGKNWGEMK